ncbi:MAG: hypothetical protein Aurels2KO_45240 [Aureliella sp.]
MFLQYVSLEEQDIVHDLEFYLVFQPQPTLDLDEAIFEILEAVGIQDLIGSGTFGNREGAVWQDFQIVANSSHDIKRIVEKILRSEIDTTHAKIKTASGEFTMQEFVLNNS